VRGLCLGFGIVFVFKRENGTAKFEHRITENDMLWKTSKGNFLLQWEIAPLPLIAGGLNHPVSEESFDKATTYYEITSSGNVVKKYGQPQAILLEDKAVVSAIHRVIGDTLYHFYWSQASGHEAEIQIDKRLRKLQLYEGPLPFDPATVITAYEQAVVQLAQDRAWKPPPSAVLEDTAGHTFRMFEMTVTHKYTVTLTGYDPHMDDDVPFECEAIDYHRFHLTIPSGWYRDDAFAAAVETRMREAIGKSLLKEHYREQQGSLAFEYMFPSPLGAMDTPPTEGGNNSPHHYGIFNDDYSFKETSPSKYKEFLSGLRVHLPASRMVYKESGSLKPHTTLAPFMAVLGPLLRVYGFRGTWHGSLGGPQGGRLEYSECKPSSDGYSALGGYQKIRGSQLVHSVTGEKLDMSVEIDLLNYSSDEIRLRFEGAAGEVEKFRAAVRPVLEECMQR
jgi:hypothetical protein